VNRTGGTTLVSLLLLATASLCAAPAAADAPLAAGWWNLAHQGIAPPAPPDVGPTDLLVQGGPQQPSGLAALRFVVPDGAGVGPLVLPLAKGAAPARADAVLACPTTEAWKPAANGAWSAAPTWACERSAAAALSDDGTSLVVPDIVRLLAEDGTLSFAIVAGRSDRVVLAAPSATALLVTPRAAPPPVASAAPPPAPPPAPAPAAAPPAFSTGVVPFAPQALAPLPPPQVGPAPPPAAVVRTGAAAAPAVTAAAHPTDDDARTRWVLAAEALLVLAFFGLLGAGPFGRLAAFTGQPVPSPDRPRGIGRFASPRSGRAPSL
jgi:hypothetical protein